MKEVRNVIQKIDQKKAPGYDLITGKILRELPDVGVKFLTSIYNPILQRSYVPPQWKVAEIIMIPKPGKTAEETKSYRPISLLPIPSKIMEILISRRLKPIIDEYEIIPKHQFGFRNKHSTIEQVHRIVDEINKSLQEKNTARQFS